MFVLGVYYQFEFVEACEYSLYKYEEGGHVLAIFLLDPLVSLVLFTFVVIRCSLYI